MATAAERVSRKRRYEKREDDATDIPQALFERANLGRLRLQHWEAEAPNAIMGGQCSNPGENSGSGSDIRACAVARN
jgi:ribosomal protein L32